MPTHESLPIGHTERARRAAVAILRAAADNLERLPRRRATQALMRAAEAVETVRREVLGPREAPGKE
jgi:hypothetical protein